MAKHKSVALAAKFLVFSGAIFLIVGLWRNFENVWSQWSPPYSWDWFLLALQWIVQGALILLVVSIASPGAWKIISATFGFEEFEKAIKKRRKSEASDSKSPDSKTMSEETSDGKPAKSKKWFWTLLLTVIAAYLISGAFVLAILFLTPVESWFRAFRLVGLGSGVLGATLSLSTRALRGVEDIQAQAGTYVGHNPHLVRALTMDTRIARLGMVLILVGFFNQLIGNLG